MVTAKDGTSSFVESLYLGLCFAGLLVCGYLSAAACLWVGWVRTAYALVALTLGMFAGEAGIIIGLSALAALDVRWFDRLVASRSFYPAYCELRVDLLSALATHTRLPQRALAGFSFGLRVVGLLVGCAWASLCRWVLAIVRLA